jgi:hydroxypyruvate isomerase
VKKLKELGYDGLIGMEFRPSTTEAEAFEKVKAIFQA